LGWKSPCTVYSNGARWSAPNHLLDSYQCNMMALIIQMQELGVEVQHIPGGCTGIC
jgi:hypothetical protein